MLFLCFVLIVLAELSTADPRIDSFHVSTEIYTRFATTLVTSRVLNSDAEAKDVTFQMFLPDAAFISNFTMKVGDEIIVGDVKGKEEAQKRYNAAKNRGETAGLVKQSPRDSNRFDISINLAAQDKATFNLTYQEVLKRVHSNYKHVVHIQPGQVIDDMKVTVQITEDSGIKSVKVPKIAEKAGDLPNNELMKQQDDPNVVISNSNSVATLTYTPSREQQKAFGVDGVEAQMAVLYDVERDDSAGQIKVVDGFFVHYFAPEGIPVGSKHIVFVLDKSGSMGWSKKMEQLKDAMSAILPSLRDDDEFNIVIFSDGVTRWRKESVKATKANVIEAVDFVRGLEADGSTNISGALEEALKVLNAGTSTLASMVVFLTDGLPSAGERSVDGILGVCFKANKERTNSIHSISFGLDADFDLLQKISLQNKGLARRVYAESDAAIQLKGFYEQISSPLLKDVKFDYLDNSIDITTLIEDGGDALYSGGEVIAVGRINMQKVSEEGIELRVKVEAQGRNGIAVSEMHRSIPCWQMCDYQYSMEYHNHSRVLPPRCPVTCPPRPLPEDPSPQLDSSSLGGFIERMWAYMTIKKLLADSKFKAGLTHEKKEEMRKEALDMSIKYNFVTELTSMVVTKDGEATVLEENHHRFRHHQSGSHWSPGAGIQNSQGPALPPPPSSKFRPLTVTGIAPLQLSCNSLLLLLSLGMSLKFCSTL